MNKIRYKNLFFLLFFISVNLCHAQMAVPFKERYKANIKGDMTIIANSILNRIDKKNSPNDPYNDQSIDAITNDEIDMEYIDIDTDKQTFSSSSAALFQKNEASKKIVYAGLYWSATYKYESGYKKGQDKFVAFDNTREPFEEIVVKFPDQKEYATIKGEIIFDGLKHKEFKDAAPYAVYADITEQVKALKNPFGFYTVGNVRATQGTLIGGSAAGWTMIFVYEDASMSEKFIVSHDGFAGASSESVNVVFKGFKTQPQGNVQVKLAGAALEGDFKVDGDLFMFGSSKNKDFTNVKTVTRRYSNFFDSSITIEDEHFKYRIPDGKNTLGYDSFLTTLSNYNNRFIGNNMDEATVRFKSSGDVFYLFFSAMAIETKPAVEVQADTTKLVYEDNKFKVVDKTTNEEIVQNQTANDSLSASLAQKAIDGLAQDSKENTKSIVAEVEKIPEVKETKQEPKPAVTSKPEAKKEPSTPIAKKETVTKKEEPKTAVKPDVVKVTKTDEVKPKINPVVVAPEAVKTETPKEGKQPEIEVLNDIDSPKGYYLVVNVFNERVNAARFMKSLRDKGLNPNYFTNPANNYMYVYLGYVTTREEADKLIENKLNNLYTEEMWILVINMNK
ncbi:SPOR domain-containing protein [Flavobacterium azooxidireducens]|uniref:SPOR domain-containing protein n=1 Tax=Flavobacterium azooxidireducens TaxID=1871076 RepID=A0ABY4KL26_9FLAO|nr:SPOR domain-containing protein [Flavobacterium azooxidireducens]UPQ80473.1 SPOR domain-containing protein [Flavobacterium azooxidireducens]